MPASSTSSMWTKSKKEKVWRKDCCGRCAACGSENPDYHDHDFDGDCIIFGFTCEDCGADGEEVHRLDYQYTKCRKTN